MDKNIFLIRHFKDADNLFGANDNPILKSELLKVGKLAKSIISELPRSNPDRACILTSCKRRAVMTAKEIAKEIENFLPTKVEIDPRIREIDQGECVLPPTYNPGDFYPPLAKAWEVYFAETFENKNLTYRFGDPLDKDGSLKYPEISESFSKYGENQIEFSIRFYSFVRDLLQTFSGQRECVPIIVTHQAMLARFREIVMIAEKADLNNIDLGTLPLLEWEQFKEISKNKDGFAEHGEITILSLSPLCGLQSILIREIEYLKSN